MVFKVHERGLLFDKRAGTSATNAAYLNPIPISLQADKLIEQTR